MRYLLLFDAYHIAPLVPPPARPPPVRAHTASRNAVAPPSRPAQTDQNFPWVVAQRYGAALARSPALPESWVARCLFPSPPFPDPNGDVSGSAWEGPDLPGTGGGKGGGDDSIFQVFGVSELRPVQLLTALAPDRAAALAGGLGGGRAAGSSYLDRHLSTLCK